MKHEGDISKPGISVFPKNKEAQIQFLIQFIDEYKNTTDYKHITEMVLFILTPILANQEERTFINNAIYNAIEEEETEIEEALAENHEALLSDISHRGLELLKKALADLLCLPKKEDAENNVYDVVTRRPPNLIIPNTKLVNLLFDGKTDLSEESLIRVSRKNAKKQYTIKAQSYSFIDDDNIVPTNLSPLEREVLNGVCSLADSGQYIFTDSMIYEAFTGRRNPTSQPKKKVEKIITHFRTSLCSIDWLQHAKMCGIYEEGEDYLITRENILLIRDIKARINGTETNAYLLLEPPILYRYAKAVGQIISVDKSLLQMDGISNTEDSIVLKNYIIAQIAQMKNPKNHRESNTITFSKMFEKCGVKSNRTERKRKRELAIRIIDELISKGYITGKTVDDEKQSVTIHFVPDLPKKNTLKLIDTRT